MIRIWLILLSLLSNILALALPLTLIQVYDRILANQAIGTALVLFSAVLIAIVLDGIVKFSRSALFSRLGGEAEYRLSMATAQRVLSMRQADLQRFGAGHIAELFGAVARSRDVLIGQTTLALFDAPFAIVFLVLVWFLGGPVVLVPLAIAAIVGLLAFGVAFLNRRAAADQFDARAEHKSLLFRGASRIEQFRTQGLAGGLMARLRRTLVSGAAADERSERYTGALMDLTQIASLVASIGILGVGAALALQGEMTSGAIAACLILGQRAVASLVGILSGLARRQMAAAAHRTLREAIGKHRAYEVVSTDGDQGAEPAPIGLTWTAPSGEDISVNAGEMRILEFPHAADATDAFLALRDEFITPAPGAKSKAPQLVTGTSAQADTSGASGLAERVAMVDAMPVLLRGSILDNLTGFDAERIDGAIELAERLGLEPAIGRLTGGYETQVGARLGSPLSTGQIKRVGLVRAMSGKPGLLVLNHPSYALDKDGTERLATFLSEVDGQMTVLVLTVDGLASALTPPSPETPPLGSIAA